MITRAAIRALAEPGLTDDERRARMDYYRAPHTQLIAAHQERAQAYDDELTLARALLQQKPGEDLAPDLSDVIGRVRASRLRFRIRQVGIDASAPGAVEHLYATARHRSQRGTTPTAPPTREEQLAASWGWMSADERADAIELGVLEAIEEAAVADPRTENPWFSLMIQLITETLLEDETEGTDQ